MNIKRLVENYDRNYKFLIIIPIILFVLALANLTYWKIEHGEFISKDITLTGGIQITINTADQYDIAKIRSQLEDELGISVIVRKLTSLNGNTIGYAFELEKIDIEQAKKAINRVTGFDFEEGTYTIEEMSSSLSASFWASTIKALALAFIFMAVVVIAYFREWLPSAAIVFCALSDIIITLAIMNLTGIKLSTGGVAALLMLIGYSVDSDILLTTKVLKRREGTLSQRVHSALKTGLTMQLTTLSALITLWAVAPPGMLKQIALILICGLTVDLINTWMQNVGLLRWYAEVKKCIK